jgi:phosphosulfolactate synthase (CoM biosynthesis protein A)
LLTDKISHLVKEAERLGFEGNIEQAQGLLKLSDQFKSEREALKKGEGLSFVSEHILFFVLISVFSCFFFQLLFLRQQN